MLLGWDTSTFQTLDGGIIQVTLMGASGFDGRGSVISPGGRGIAFASSIRHLRNQVRDDHAQVVDIECAIHVGILQIQRALRLMQPLGELEEFR
jgi:hypothetical protein